MEDINQEDMKEMNQEEIEMRAGKAKDLFKQGYNCAQSVVASCCDLYGVSEDEALRMSAGFGGGIGRMRLTCGAACGMFMLAGLENGSTTAHDQQGKMRNYELVRTLASRYQETFGSITCSELLGLTPSPVEVKHLPCAEMVAEAVRIFLREVQ